MNDETDALLVELASFYDEVDARFDGWTCPGSTECCRFGVTGREPYVTSIELAAIRRAVATRGRRVTSAPERSRVHRALPLATRAERRCPLLTEEGRCSVYAHRPFGCRTFYCDRATPAGAVRHREISDMVRRLKDLAARHARAGEEGRPLTRALRPRSLR